MAPTVVDRAELKLRAPQNRDPFVVPPRDRRGIVCHHNGPLLRLNWRDWSTAQLRGAEIDLVRGIQRYHQVTRGWSDTAYSWFIGQSGIIYVARGLMWDQFANGDDEVGPDDGPDEVWYSAMCLIGWDPDTGREEEPSPAMRESFAWLVGHVRSAGAGDRVLPHNDFKVKVCPGRTMSEDCDRLDGATINTGDPIVSFTDQLEQWRLDYNRATPDHPVDVVGWVQQFLIDEGHLGGAFAKVDRLKGPATDAAWTAWEKAAREDDEGNPHAGRRSWRLMWDRIVWPNGNPAAHPGVDPALRHIAGAIEQLSAAATALGA